MQESDRRSPRNAFRTGSRSISSRSNGSCTSTSAIPLWIFVFFADIEGNSISIRGVKSEIGGVGIEIRARYFHRLPPGARTATFSARPRLESRYFVQQGHELSLDRQKRGEACRNLSPEHRTSQSGLFALRPGFFVGGDNLLRHVLGHFFIMVETLLVAAPAARHAAEVG